MFLIALKFTSTMYKDSLSLRPQCYKVLMALVGLIFGGSMTIRVKDGIFSVTQLEVTQNLLTQLINGVQHKIKDVDLER